MKTIGKIKTTKSKLFLLGCGVAMLMTYGCSKDSPLNPLGNCGNGSWTQEVQAELTSLSNATTNYSNDPTPANCENYKTALGNYFDALEGIRGCVLGASKKAFNEAIDEAKKNLDETDCSGG